MPFALQIGQIEFDNSTLLMGQMWYKFDPGALVGKSWGHNFRLTFPFSVKKISVNITSNTGPKNYDNQWWRPKVQESFPNYIYIWYSYQMELRSLLHYCRQYGSNKHNMSLAISFLHCLLCRCCVEDRSMGMNPIFSIASIICIE